MRIYLAPCGMGVGHISRCNKIANMLAERGWSVVISTYAEGLEYARKLRYPIMDTVHLEMKTYSDGKINFKLTAATSPGLFRGLWLILKQIVAEMKNILRVKPVLVISDSRASTLIAAKLLHVPSIAILNEFSIKLIRRPSGGNLGPLDKIFFFIANLVWVFVSPFIGWFWSFADKILIPDLPPPYTISSEHLAIPRSCASKVEFIGPMLGTISSNPSRMEVRNRLGYDPEKPIIVVPLSVMLSEGSDFIDRVEGIMEKLSNRYQIVMSRGKVSGSPEARRRDGLTVYDWISDLDEYLKACDLVISRAGHMTILTSLAYGKPLLLMPVPDHPEQLGNARRASELGVALTLSQDELSVDRIGTIIKHMLDSPEYERKATEIEESMRNMSGIEKVVESVEQLSQERGTAC